MQGVSVSGRIDTYYAPLICCGRADENFRELLPLSWRAFSRAVTTITQTLPSPTSLFVERRIVSSSISAILVRDSSVSRQNTRPRHEAALPHSS